MAFDSHIVTVRRLKKYIDDVIGKKANLPNNTKTIVDNVAGLFDMYHPIGCLYPTTDSKFNPNTATGWHGKWERIKDCVIYASGDSDTVGQIVGSNTHTLTTSELPSHTHSIPALSGSTNSAGTHKHKVQWKQATTIDGTHNRWYACPTPDKTTGDYTESAGDHTHSVTTNASTTGSQGSGTAIDIRPRRLNSVVWRRIS